MKRLVQWVVAAVLFALSASSMAHGALTPKHGGIVGEANDVVYELVTTPDSIVIYIEDHGKKVNAAGASGKLILLNGKEKTELDLRPIGDNKLEAKGQVSVASGTKAVASVTLAGKAAATVRFVLK